MENMENMQNMQNIQNSNSESDLSIADEFGEDFLKKNPEI